MVLIVLKLLVAICNRNSRKSEETPLNQKDVSKPLVVIYLHRVHSGGVISAKLLNCGQLERQLQ